MATLIHKMQSSLSFKMKTNNNSTSTPPDAKSASSCLVVLFRLIESNDWQKIDNMFLSDPEGQRTFQYLSALVAKSSSFNGMTILHACARFNPPSSMVRTMIELCPDAPHSQDCLNRTPLHVATGTGASSPVIKALVDAYPAACLIQDKDGRSPLHMACDASCELFEDDRSSERPAPSYRTIGVLLSASLESAVLEDEDGMSAIEYALFSNADLQTVRLIQKAAQKVMLNKRDQERASKARGELSNNSGNNPSSVAVKKFHARRGVINAPQA